MVAGCQQEPAVCEGFVEVGSAFNQAVEVSPLLLLGSAGLGRCPSIPSPLHRAVKVSDIQDPGIPLLCLLEMDCLETLVRMGIVVVGI